MPDGIIAPREEHKRRIADSLRRQLGSRLCALLAEPGVIELMLNPNGRVWVDRLGSGMEPVFEMSAEAAESFIVTVASTVGTVVTRDNPILECTLPTALPFNGARFEAVLQPVVSAPTFTIRMKASSVFTLEDYELQGIITAAQREAIEQAVRNRENIIIAGGTSSGKTTLLNAVIDCTAQTHPDHRLVLMEQVGELQCRAANHVPMLTTDTVSLQRLLKVLMRLRPDRPIVGEVRGGEALELLKAWNTGHNGGASTLHANSAADALIRFEQCIQEVSWSPMQRLIGAAVDLIVFIQKTKEPPGRKVTEVVRVHGFADGEYQLSTLE